MADPIMDLFEDTPLFNLDALPDDSFSQGSTDPVEEALKLALGQVDPPTEPEPTVELAVNSALSVPVAAPSIPDPAPVQVHVQQSIPMATAQTVSMAEASTVAPTLAPSDALPQIQAQNNISIASNTSGVSCSTVLLSSPLAVSSSPATTTATTSQLAQITHQLTPQQLAAIAQQAGGKIVILKGPQGQAQVLQTVSGATSQTTGKVIRVLSGTPLKPGMSILQGGTVLSQASPGQAQVKVGTGVQRLLQSPNGPVKQLLLTSMPQQTQGQQVQVQIPTQAQVAQGQTQVQVQPQAQIQVQGQAAQIHVQPQGQTAQIQVQTQSQVQLQPAMQAHTQVSTSFSSSSSIQHSVAPPMTVVQLSLTLTLTVYMLTSRVVNQNESRWCSSSLLRQVLLQLWVRPSQHSNQSHRSKQPKEGSRRHQPDWCWVNSPEVNWCCREARLLPWPRPEPVRLEGNPKFSQFNYKCSSSQTSKEGLK